MHNNTAERYALALKVMRDETCATKEQQDKFTTWLLERTNNVWTPVEANNVVATGVREIANPGQLTEANQLLLKHGFIDKLPKQPRQTMRIVLDIEVDGHPTGHNHEATDLHTWDYGLVGQVLDAVRNIEAPTSLHDKARGREVVDVTYDSYVFNPTKPHHLIK